MFLDRTMFGPFWLILWLSVLPPHPAAAGSTAFPAPAQAMNFTVEGKITRLDPNRITLSTEENIFFRVRYDDKTEIRRKDGAPGSAKDLRVGLRVRVDGELTESGEIIAHQIALQQEPPARQSARPAPRERIAYLLAAWSFRFQS